MGPVTYLLDTCTFIWLTSRPELLSRSAEQACNLRGHELWLRSDLGAVREW